MNKVGEEWFETSNPDFCDGFVQGVAQTDRAKLVHGLRFVVLRIRQIRVKLRVSGTFLELKISLINEVTEGPTVGIIIKK